MRWVWALGVACRGEEDGETGLPAGETGADTGTTPLPPCPWARDWAALNHDCTQSEALSLSAVLGEDCVLVLTAERYAQYSGSPYPPLCSTAERIELRYDEPSATWRATSIEQSSNLEGCYADAVGEYPLGVADIQLVSETLSIGLSPAPWTLSECAEAVLTLTP